MDEQTQTPRETDTETGRQTDREGQSDRQEDRQAQAGRQEPSAGLITCQCSGSCLSSCLRAISGIACDSVSSNACFEGGPLEHVHGSGAEVSASDTAGGVGLQHRQQGGAAATAYLHKMLRGLADGQAGKLEQQVPVGRDSKPGSLNLVEELEFTILLLPGKCNTRVSDTALRSLLVATVQQ